MNPPDKKKMRVRCRCGVVEIEGPPNFLRRIADRTDVRFRCHNCRSRIVCYDGEPARFAPESEVGP
jgi:hypothetical protein